MKMKYKKKCKKKHDEKLERARLYSELKMWNPGDIYKCKNCDFKVVL
jgi:hypothetical protein